MLSRRNLLVGASFIAVARPAAAAASPTVFGVVYGTASNIIRRFVVPDADSELGKISLLPGESLAQLPLANFPVITVASVQPAIGPPLNSARCAAIDDKGVVATIIMADPTVDATLGAYAIMQSDKAQPGDKIGGKGVLVRDFAVVVGGVVTDIKPYPIDDPVADPGTKLVPAKLGATKGQPPPADLPVISDSSAVPIPAPLPIVVEP